MHKPAIFLSALLLLTSACSKKEEAEATPVAPVQVAPVQTATVQRVVGADAVLYPIDQSGVNTKIQAPVQKFYVNRGDHVKQGQLLATLENRDLVAAAAAAKGQLDQADANLRTTANATVPEALTKATTDVQSAQQQLDAAQKLLESRENLFKQGALARRLVDEAQVAYAQAKAQFQSAQEHLQALQSVGNQEQIRGARAQVESARGQLQSAEAQVAYTQVRAPISGIVAERPLYEGEMANPGTAIMTIVDISRVVARASVPQGQAANLKPGDAATIRVTEGSYEVPGKVTVVSPTTEPGTTTVQVWVQADNPGERLKPGESVHVAIVAGTIRDAVVVPQAAILPAEEGGSAVVTVGPDNVAHLKKVETGVVDNGKVQILSGAAPGERVVTVGGVGLADNGKVRIVQPGEKGSEEK